MDPLLPVLHATVDELESELVGLRRDLHAHPELARLETRTTRVVADRLSQAGLEPTLLDGSGVVVDIGAEQPAYLVALRADLDALPIPDRTGLDWASVTEGVAHACGHDLHTAMVLGAGLALVTQAPALSSAGLGVRLIFQPAEEVIPGGAHEIIDGGWLTGVDEVFALHIDPSRDVGEVGLLVGPITAASDGIEVTLKGHGGHTSRPHLTQDLTFALAKVVTEVPAALGRRLDPRAGAALVWGSVHAGGAQNVIPSVGTASGTLRILDADLWRDVGPLVEELVEAVVAPYAVTTEVRYTQGVPPVVNAGPSVDSLRDAAHAAGHGPGHDGPVPRRRGLRVVSDRGAGGHGTARHPHAGRPHLRPSPGRPRDRRAGAGIRGKSPGRRGSGRRPATRTGVARRSESITFPAR
jgi:amidohydrolase